MGYSWPTAEGLLINWSLIMFLQEADSMQLKVVRNNGRAFKKAREKRKKHLTSNSSAQEDKMLACVTRKHSFAQNTPRFIGFDSITTNGILYQYI